MIRQYTCLFMQQSEIDDICQMPVEFTNGRNKDQNCREKIEDWAQLPVIYIAKSAYNDNQIMVCTAPGYAFTHQLTGKRTKIISGSVEDVKLVLEDIFANRSDENPEDIFREYGFDCPMPQQFELNQWIRTRNTK